MPKNRGIQNNEEYIKEQEAIKRKKRKAAKECLQMAGFSILEFVLCMICLILFLLIHAKIHRLYAHVPETRRVTSSRHILLLPLPMIVASVYLALTYVDLMSFLTMRPITYYAWIMVSASGFLLFFLAAGVLILESTVVAVLVAIVFAIITGVVFLIDLICLFLVLKRFPVPHWVLTRWKEQTDCCICADNGDIEEEVKRPLCRCGDVWDEPCVCDIMPGGMCKCGAVETGEPPCPCCVCVPEDGPDNISRPENIHDLISVGTGRDFIEPSLARSVHSQIMTDRQLICVDGPARGPSKSIRPSARPSTFGYLPDMRKSMARDRGTTSRVDIEVGSGYDSPSAKISYSARPSTISGVPSQTKRKSRMMSRVLVGDSTDEDLYMPSRPSMMPRQSSAVGPRDGRKSTIYTVPQDNLPGQVPRKSTVSSKIINSPRDSTWSTRSTTASRTRITVEQDARPKSEGSSMMIRNVSTTVKPSRTLSRVNEGHECGQSVRTAPSQSTITLTRCNH
ncbi:uncharacterized protein LOC115879416 [Sitophilus oryzae]|uniref:Uncharacterized protein LOC115879416 n=1 Tax=Sitophilus oryzae TaxID=7048 RepID=A0A6J2XKR7_SITOR|nr:uncharacterized protein LOC115879416 [Sitophilus oryzae]